MNFHFFLIQVSRIHKRLITVEALGSLSVRPFVYNCHE